MVCDANGNEIVGVNADEEPLARLIAAAPELLEALEKIRQAIYGDWSEHEGRVMRANFAPDAVGSLDALIAKARGEA